MSRPILMLLCTCMWATICTKEQPQPETVSLVNRTSGPSSIANGSVNVITGNYVESGTDYVVSGPDLYVLGHTYINTDLEGGNLGFGWTFHHNHRLEVFMPRGLLIPKGSERAWYSSEDEFEREYFNEEYMPKGSSASTSVYVIDPAGGRLLFQGDKRWKHLHLVTKNTGITNTSSGAISGKTNIKNTTVSYHKSARKWCVTCGDGTKRWYAITKKPPKEFDPEDRRCYFAHFHLVKEEKPSGNTIVYEYDGDGHNITKITTLSPKKEVLNWAKFCHVTGKEWRHRPRIRVETSDGKTCIFHHTKMATRNAKHAYVITKIERPGLPDEVFTYQGVTKHHEARVSKKEHSDGYFLESSYFNRDNKFLAHRIQSQKAKISKGLDPVTTHSYNYYKRGEKAGYTDVIDAFGNVTRYHYNKEHRLYRLEYFEGKATRIHAEEFLWDKDSGQLNRHTLFNENNHAIFCRVYTYDKRGNILKESLYGAVSGPVKALERDRHGFPLPSNEVAIREFTYSNDGLNNTLSEKDPLGNWTYYEYLPKTHLLTATYTCIGTSVVKRVFYDYDGSIPVAQIRDDGTAKGKDNITGATHRLIRRAIPRRNAPHYGAPEIISDYFYDCETKKEVLLQKNVNTYNEKGLVTKTSLYDADDILQTTTECAYDSFNRIIYKKDAVGREEFLTYTETGQVKTKKGPRPDVTYHFLYDLLGKTIEEKEVWDTGLTFSTTYRYDPLGRKIATTNAQGHTTEYTYDALGRVTSVISPAIATPEGHVRPTKRYSYSNAGSVITTTDEGGAITTTTLNAYGKEVHTQLHDATAITCSYDLVGNKIYEKGANGTTTKVTYDGIGRVLTTKIADETASLSVKTMHYKGLLLAREVGPTGEALEITYDGAGRKKETLFQGKRTVFIYDSLNRVSEERSYYGKGENEFIAKKSVYDALNRPTTETLEDAGGTLFSKKRIGYDIDDNVSEEIHFVMDTRAVTQRLFYPHNVLSQETNALGHTTHVLFDYFFINGRGETVIKKTNIAPNGVRAEELFDIRGLPERVCTFDPFGTKLAEKRMFYDVRGLCIKTEEDAVSNGKVLRTITTLFSYDAMARPVTVTQAFGTSEQKTTSFLYNAYGQKEKDIRADGSFIAYTYDTKGRISSQTSSDSTINYVYCYDANDRILSVTNRNTSQATIRSYDSDGHLHAETFENGLTMQYAYDGMGRVTAITYPDSSTAEYEYSPASLKKVRRNGLEYEILERDLSGHILTARLPGEAGLVSFTYDLLGRRISSTHDLFQEKGVTYDAVGNLLHLDIVDSLGDRNENYSYDFLNQLATEDGAIKHTYTHDSLNNRVQRDATSYDVNALHAVTKDATNTYTYDANGNRIKKSSSTTYTYDALDRLIEVSETNGKKISYSYDAFHRRVCKEVSTSSWLFGSSTTTERYLYIVENEVGYLDADGTMRQLRLLGEGPGAEIGATVLFEVDSIPFVPLHDMYGSIAAVIDPSSGYLHESYRYSAFGEMHSSPSTPISPWRFSGKRADDETGLIYFGRRYYDPSLGKWLTQDPLGLKAGPNLYAYVLNNPLTHIDLYGLEAVSLLNLLKIGNPEHILKERYNRLTAARETRKPLDLTRQDQKKSDCTKDILLHPPKTDCSNRVFSDVHITGTFTTDSDARRRSEYIEGNEGLNDSRHVLFLGKSWIGELVELFKVNFGIRTEFVDECHRTLKFEIKKAARTGQQSTVRVTAHSRGTAHAYLAMSLLTCEERKFIEYYGFGGIKQIDPKKMGIDTAHNFVSKWDVIPFIFSPFEVIWGSMMSKEPYVTIVNEGFQSPHVAHSFEEKQYEKCFRHIFRATNVQATP